MSLEDFLAGVGMTLFVALTYILMLLGLPDAAAQTVLVMP